MDFLQFLSEKPLKCEEPNLTQIFSKPSELTGVIYELIKREDNKGFCEKNVEQLMTEAGLRHLYVIIKDDLEELGIDEDFTKEDFEELYEEEGQTTLQVILDLIEDKGDKTKFKNFVREIYEMD